MAKHLEPVPYESLIGKRVRVYRNLHNYGGEHKVLYSVQHKGLVIAHVPQITLDEVSFSVQPAGQAKVRQTKRKQVHAFVNGVVAAPGHALVRKVSYNPYQTDTFVLAGPLGQVPVLAAGRINITQVGLFI
jgi:hypothetical protein